MDSQERIRRIIETYTLSEILEAQELEEEDMVHILFMLGVFKLEHMVEPV